MSAITCEIAGTNNAEPSTAYTLLYGVEADDVAGVAGGGETDLEAVVPVFATGRCVDYGEDLFGCVARWEMAFAAGYRSGERRVWLVLGEGYGVFGAVGGPLG